MNFLPISTFPTKNKPPSPRRGKGGFCLEGIRSTRFRSVGMTAGGVHATVGMTIGGYRPMVGMTVGVYRSTVSKTEKIISPSFQTRTRHENALTRVNTAD